MNNFKLIDSNINVDPFLLELEYYLTNHTWGDYRAKTIKVLKNTECISLRDGIVNNIFEKQKTSFEELIDSEDDEINIYNYVYFKNTYKYLEEFADSLGGQLSLAMIVNLPPREKVFPHFDEGEYYKTRDRYHLPIKTKGSINICNGETQEYKTGELWWFNNKKMHEAYNNSDEDRIRIIFDVLPEKRNFLKRLVDYTQKYRLMISHRT